MNNLALILSLSLSQVKLALRRSRLGLPVNPWVEAHVSLVHRVVMGKDGNTPLLDLDWMVLGNLEDMRDEWNARAADKLNGTDGEGI